SFHRLYLSTMGETPARAVEKIRTHAAQEMLETTSVSIKAIAQRCGYGSEAQMRRAFNRVLGISPSDYRERFQLAGLS
ncbi:MAG: helix-turn-helix domain-containing protein, partial [Pseudomonadota bacterium]